MRMVPFVLCVSLWAAVAQPAQTAVTGAPYSADQMQEREGSQGPYLIGHLYRDSAGRTRTESALKSTPACRIEILDPVAGFRYVLDEKNKTVHRTRTAAATARENSPRQATVQDLGTRVIDGLPAEGRLSSTVLLTIETWDSVDLKVNLLTKSSNGYTTRLTNVKRLDPNPALFLPPADYQVVDESATDAGR